MNLIVSLDIGYVNNYIHLARKYARIFVRGHYQTQKANTFQIFFATRAVLKIGEYINNSVHLARKYAGIFVRGHYSFREVTVSYEEQICSRTNIRAYFRPKWRLLCLLPFNIFRNARRF